MEGTNGSSSGRARPKYLRANAGQCRGEWVRGCVAKGWGGVDWAVCGGGGEGGWGWGRNGGQRVWLYGGVCRLAARQVGGLGGWARQARSARGRGVGWAQKGLPLGAGSEPAPRPCHTAECFWSQQAAAHCPHTCTHDVMQHDIPRISLRLASHLLRSDCCTRPSPSESSSAHIWPSCLAHRLLCQGAQRAMQGAAAGG